MRNTLVGEAVPEPQSAYGSAYAEAAVGITALSYQSGHHATTFAGRVTLCAMALAIVVRVAARMPAGCQERRALARAAEELRQVV